MEDVTKIRNQPALWAPGRARWLLPAGLLGAVAIFMLALTIPLQIIIPSAGIVLTVLAYLAMIGCAIWVRDAHERNLAFAWLMSAMAFFPLLALSLVVLGETRA